VVREEVEAGLVYASDVAVAHGQVVIAAHSPKDSHDPIRYPIAAVKGTRSPAGARLFIDMVLGAAGQKILQKYGFQSSR